MKKSFSICCLLMCSIASSIAYANQAMVVSEQRIASQAGIDILRAGGNAIDAAVAVGYALAVVNPCCGNIGGGGFMVIHFANGKNTVINFREKAPLKATKNMYSGSSRPDITTRGYLAVAVPGTVMGLDTALEKYGTMTRQQVMAPAINLAEHGYHITRFDALWLKEYAPSFRQQPNVAAIFLNDGKPYNAGDLLIQKDLANSLKLIAEKGTDAFYKGHIAHEIVKASEAGGGILTLKDFAQYKVQEMAPIQCKYRGYTILSAPPPSSGGVVLCEMLAIMENLSLNKNGFHTAADVHNMVETMRYGFHDRNTKLGDPDFIHNPVYELLSPEYTERISKNIRSTKTLPHIKFNMNPHEQTDTTHYSILDKNGNAVSVTYTINGFFGAQVIAGDTGFFLNDSMDDFTTQNNMINKFNLVQSPVNNIAGGKRPLSSMTPTIVMKDNHIYMILGSPGGPRIITTIFQTLINVIDYGMNIKQAINAPRFHFQVFPDEIQIEPHALPLLTQIRLKQMGYKINQLPNWSAVEAILIDNNKTLHGANDYRRPDGAAIAY